MELDRLLAVVDGSTARRMFGGVGIYADGAKWPAQVAEDDTELAAEPHRAIEAARKKR